MLTSHAGQSCLPPVLKSITTCLAAVVGVAHAAEAVVIAAEGTGMAKA
jgi:hypothetical protein